MTDLSTPDGTTVAMGTPSAESVCNPQGWVTMERRHARRPVDRVAKIFIADGEGMPCRIRDVSKGGAKIRIAWTAWLPDTFDLQDSFTQVRRQVRLVWREANCVGVCFTDEGQWPVPPQSKGFGRRWE